MVRKKLKFLKSAKTKVWNLSKKTLSILVILFLLFQVYKINRFIDQQSTDTGVSQVDVLSNDIREIREYLLLPTHTLSEEEAEDQSLESAFYTYLGRYNEDKTIKEKREKQAKLLSQVTEGTAMEIAINSEDTDVQLEKSPEEKEEYIVKADGYNVLSFGINLEQDLFLTTPLKQQNLTSSEFQAAVTEELEINNLKALALKAKEIEENLQKLRDLNNNPEISEQLKSRGLTVQLQEALLPDNTYEAQLIKEDGAVALKIAYFPQDKIFYLNDEYSVKASEDFTSFESLISGLRDYVLNTKFSSLAEQQVENSLQKLLELANSNSFQESLKDTGLKPKNIKKSEAEYKLPIVKISDESLVFAIIIDRSDASIWIEEGDQRQPLLEEFTNFDSSLITTHPSGEFNLLLAGKHGTLTDTMILTHINENTRKITLVSIPRDLFWKDRKINSFYVYFGMEGLVKELERMTGQKIDGYALIDMYAFIDVVDYLGGIDVTLDEALADPTYKTLDDGRWGTLYYAAGTHHVSGVQALRIARSRHTSSDFSRAKRQHLIIEAFKDKANSMKFQNPKKMFDLANTLLEKVDTNISASQGISYFFKYKDYEISGQNVLSTGNILVSDHLPTYQGKVLPEGSECNEDCVGMYILKPYAGWGSIPNYINNIFKS
jgi:LCP family protein required for cell wall assembly